MAHDVLVRPRLDSAASLIATVGGVGLLPIAPGTWCSFVVAAPVAVAPWLGMRIDPDLFRTVYLVLAVIFTVLGCWAVPRIQDEWGSDPKCVVVDEAAGMSMILVLPFAYHTVWWWLASVLLFRVFDIQKPWPLSSINRRTEAWAVMLDDILAAAFTIIALYLMLLAVQVIVVGSAGL